MAKYVVIIANLIEIFSTYMPMQRKLLKEKHAIYFTNVYNYILKLSLIILWYLFLEKLFDYSFPMHKRRDASLLCLYHVCITLALVLQFLFLMHLLTKDLEEKSIPQWKLEILMFSWQPNSQNLSSMFLERNYLTETLLLDSIQAFLSVTVIIILTICQNQFPNLGNNEDVLNFWVKKKNKKIVTECSSPVPISCDIRLSSKHYKLEEVAYNNKVSVLKRYIESPLEDCKIYSI